MMNKKININILIISFLIIYVNNLSAQDKALVNTSTSKYAKLTGLDMSDVTWTNGFWADRFKVCRETMIPNLWKIYSDPKMGHAIQNFEIAAGLDTGSHGGAPFQDGDFYKLFEAAAAIYASTHDSKIDKLMDQTIALIAKAQRADGYINTQTLIDERNRPKEGKAFEDRMNFENGWENNLYREVSTKNDGSAYIRLIPYYAWDNRGHNNMETWIPFDR